MEWFCLVLAGILEIIWAIGLKHTEGFTKVIPSGITIVAMILSFWLLSISLRAVPLSVAYAVWTGIGILGTVIFGILWFDEPVNAMKIICISLLIIGIVGLKLL